MNSSKENDGHDPMAEVLGNFFIRTVQDANNLNCLNISSIHDKGFSYRTIETHSNGTITEHNQTKQVLGPNDNAQNVNEYDPFSRR